MKGLKGFLVRFFGNLKSSFSYYPITILLCIIFAVLFVYRNEYMDYAGDALLERIDTIFIGLGIAIFMSMVIQLLINYHEKAKKFSLIVWLMGLALSVIYYFIAIKDLEMVTLIRAFVLMAVMFCVYIVLSWVFKKDEVEKFSVKFMIESVISYFYAGVLFGGLMLIDFAFETLMDVNPKHEFVIFALAFSFFIVFPMLVFSRIQEEYKQSKILRILIINIIMPLLVAYTAVLYMYFIRMLVLWDIPSNMITNLVFWYVLIGIFTLFIANLYENGKKWLKLFVNFFPLLTILPLGLMFMALLIRITNYGFTEPRYTLLIIGIWELLVIGYLIFFKKERRIIAVLPVSLAVISILLVASPFSMFNVSKINQNKRFDELYKNIETLSKEDSGKLLSIAYYFEDYHDIEDLTSFPDGMTLNEFATDYDLQLIETPRNYYGTNVVFENSARFLEVTDYDYMIHNFWDEINIKSDYTFNISYKRKDLLIMIDDVLIAKIDIFNEMKNIVELNQDKETNDHMIMLKDDDYPIIYENDDWKIRVIIGEFFINVLEPNQQNKPYNLTILIKKK